MIKRGLSGTCFRGCSISPEIVIYDEIPNWEIFCQNSPTVLSSASGHLNIKPYQPLFLSTSSLTHTSALLLSLCRQLRSLPIQLVSGLFGNSHSSCVLDCFQNRKWPFQGPHVSSLLDSSTALLGIPTIWRSLHHGRALGYDMPPQSIRFGLSLNDTLRKQRSPRTQ